MGYIAGTVTTGSGATGKYECRLEYIFNSQNQINNTTNITIKLQARANNSAYSTTTTWDGYIGPDPFSIYATVGGNTNWVTLATKTWDQAHNPDGSLTYHTSAYFGNDLTSEIYALKHGSVGDYIVFPTIPRESSVTATNADIGSATSININRNSSSFTHTLRYSFYDLSGTIVTKTADISYGWTIPTSFYAKIPNSPSGICTIYCDTYSGDNLIGTKSTTFSVIANETLCKPEITATVIDTNSTTIALTGDNTKLVKGYSTAQITYTITTKNSATLISKTLNGGNLGNSPYSVPNIDTGNLTISAVDSRGYVTNLYKSNTTINYIPLTLNFTAFRPTPTGSEIKVNFSGNYFNSTFGSETNTLDLSWKYRLSGAGSWTDGGTFALNTDYKISGNTFFSGTGTSASDISLDDELFIYTNVYDIAIYYQDKLVSTSQVKTVPKGQPVLYWEDDLVGVNGEFKLNSKTFLERTYPVGAIYMSAINTSPATLFGGTWSAITGYYLYAGAGGTTAGSNTSGASSNANSGSTAITVAQMPNHSHDFLYNGSNYSQWPCANSFGPSISFALGTAGDLRVGLASNGSGEGHTHTIAHTHSVTPLRYEVYVWRRTA